MQIRTPFTPLWDWMRERVSSTSVIELILGDTEGEDVGGTKELIGEEVFKRVRVLGIGGEGGG